MFVLSLLFERVDGRIWHLRTVNSSVSYAWTGSISRIGLLGLKSVELIRT